MTKRIEHEQGAQGEVQHRTALRFRSAEAAALLWLVARALRAVAAVCHAATCCSATRSRSFSCRSIKLQPHASTSQKRLKDFNGESVCDSSCDSLGTLMSNLASIYDACCPWMPSALRRLIAVHVSRVRVLAPTFGTILGSVHCTVLYCLTCR